MQSCLTQRKNVVKRNKQFYQLVLWPRIKQIQSQIYLNKNGNKKGYYQHVWNQNYLNYVLRCNGKPFLTFSSSRGTGKSLSEAFILISTNPHFDKTLFLIYLFNTWKLQAQNMGRTICVYNMFSPCSEPVVFMYWTSKSMNNLLSYCGLVDVRINASDKDLPVHQQVVPL